MKANSELRAIARAQLKGSWLPAVGVCLVYFVILGVSGFLYVGPLVLGGPLLLGFTGYFLKKVRGETVKFENLFDGFKQFVPSLLLYLVQSVFLALWFCLLIVPGIVKSLSYSMTFYLMRDNPGIGATDAITRSRKMMDGYKGRLFLLYLSFIGWAILSCITFGIGFLWLIPYISVSTANFYEELKAERPASDYAPAETATKPAEITAGDKPVFCGECGVKNPAGTKFCGGCGVKL